MVQAVDLDAIFYCQKLETSGIYWTVNGTSLSGSNLNNVTADSIYVSGTGVVNRLFIVALRDYNETEVHCVSVNLQNLMSEKSQQAYLIVQGTLQI